MSIFNKETTDQLTEILSKLTNEVNLVYFHQETDCPTCEETLKFLNEMIALSDKIKLEVLNFANEKEKAASFGINKVPAIVITDKDKTDRGIRFYGAPAGYEINSFLASLFEASGLSEPLPTDILNRVKSIDKEIHIQVFVTPSCPHCPGAVVTAHKLAFENKNIKADMVECTVFPNEASKYNVSGVPKIIINEKYELVGNQPITAFLETIEQL